MKIKSIYYFIFVGKGREKIQNTINLCILAEKEI
jgi:hypothetical protein